MFSNTTDGPRVFGLPPGVDFATSVINGIVTRMVDKPPEALARTTLFVNTRRMQRRMRDVFIAGPARILPKIRLVTDLSNDPTASNLPPAVAPLRRRLQLCQLVARLIEQQPELAPRSAIYDLADSLANLIDEMQGEGVDPETIATLDVTDLSGHWARSLEFINLIQTFLGTDDTASDREARQRLVIENLARTWRQIPPKNPIIVAGSTGSRGATAQLLNAVANLPQGAVILPGFDFDMPRSIWDVLANNKMMEDHPQARFEHLGSLLGVHPHDIPRWDETPAPNPARNKLVSLALRPAPVTDQWRKDGPDLGLLSDATGDLTLVEAPSPRIEAEAIALRLRQAADENITAALITPDRMLTRQVSAALDRWHLTPDDSAGLPLPLSPPGRLLRHTAALFGAPISGEALLTLLKHPLCNASANRNTHILRTHELELHLRRHGPPHPTRASVVEWANKSGKADTGRSDWANWLGVILDDLATVSRASLSQLVKKHVDITQRLSLGPDGSEPSELWDKAAGRVARSVLDNLTEHADAGGELTPRDYDALTNNLLNGAEVRDRDRGHPNILIWGTLEARVQSADLIILAGLNEGTWPEAPSPDPWLNRVMRAKAGLLLPERRIGLSAHDFMQGIAGKDVWITRSIRSDDAQTVASRWLNRLTNLLNGLTDQGGPQALEEMKSRGNQRITQAIAQSDTPDMIAAVRPSPRPPVAHRPATLSVTGISTLIRNPYEIYARQILRLRALDPLSPQADAPLRGTVMHKIFEVFVDQGPEPSDPTARDELLRLSREVLAKHCPWPTNRHFWAAKIDSIADWFLTRETERRKIAAPEKLEARGEASIPDLAFTLHGRADRIDLTPDGQAVLYDYKTGKPPTVPQQKEFDKQLLLEAAMIEQGAFDFGPRSVLAATYIGLGSSPSEVGAPLDDLPPGLVWSQLHDLISKWQMPDRGYSARLSPEFITYASDYDHLSRFGEWDHTTKVTPEHVS